MFRSSDKVLVFKYNWVQILGISKNYFKMLTLPITFVLNLSCILFFSGLAGVMLNRKNILITIMSIELTLLAINLNFAACSIYLDDIVGQIFVVFILAIAAAETAVGLAILSVFYKLKNTIELKSIKNKKNSKL